MSGGADEISSGKTVRRKKATLDDIVRFPSTGLYSPTQEQCY